MNKRLRRGGFSLIELVIALGIATFAIIAIVAVLPVGLDGMRVAMEQFLEARIIHKISADLQMTPFDEIAAGSFYFDYEGAETASEKDVRYRATFGIRDHGSDVFPGASSSMSQNLAILEVDIFRVRPGGNDVLAVTFPLAVARGR